jgi:hypothetical protein
MHYTQDAEVWRHKSAALQHCACVKQEDKHSSDELHVQCIDLYHMIHVIHTQFLHKTEDGSD